MRLLLDTNAFLWWQERSPRLGRDARDAIAGAVAVYVSAASAWEIAIKASLGRLHLPESVEAGMAASGFLGLPVRFPHAAAVQELPHHHRDPFDRMLAAQALVERLVLVTADREFEPYGMPVVWT